MPRDLFGDVTRPFAGAGARSRYTVPLSLAGHTAIALAAVAAPLLATEALPALTTHLRFEAITPLVPPDPPRPRPIASAAVTPVEVSPDAAPLDVPEGIAVETGFEGVTCGAPGTRCDGGLSPGDALGVTGFSDSLAPPPPLSEPEAVRQVRPGGDVKVPTKVHDVAPVYPAIAQAARVQGIVIVQATIDVDGRVVDATVLRSVPLLDQAAVDAVRQWRYTPTRLNGQPVAVVMTVTVNFQLR